MTKNAKESKEKKEDEEQKDKPKAKLGRPTLYNDELGDKIADLLATSSKGLIRICRDCDDIPDYSTVVKWLLKEDHPFVKKYARAKEMQADYMAEEMQEIADDCLQAKFHVDKARLQVDTRKWIASKLKPKKYSERIVSEVTGKDGGAVEIKKTEYDLSGLTEEELLLFKTLSAKVVTKSNT